MIYFESTWELCLYMIICVYSNILHLRLVCDFCDTLHTESDNIIIQIELLNTMLEENANSTKIVNKLRSKKQELRLRGLHIHDRCFWAVANVNPSWIPFLWITKGLGLNEEK